MHKFAERLDPDLWIAEGRLLLDYPIFEIFSLAACDVEFLLRDQPVLAAHVNRWITHICQARIRNRHQVGGRLTEETLKSSWEETRGGAATERVNHIEEGAKTFSLPHKIAPKDAVPTAIAALLTRHLDL